MKGEGVDLGGRRIVRKEDEYTLSDSHVGGDLGEHRFARLLET